MQTTPAPVAAKSRVISLDIIRGFALLGILGPNIVVFAWPSAAMYGAEGMGRAAEVMGAEPHLVANQVSHMVVQTFFLGKMMLLFSLLFGAGIVMYSRKFPTRAQCDRCGHDLGGSAEGEPCPECDSTVRAPRKLTDGAALWYQRCGWLLIIGLVHAYGLWFGDILVWYATAALGMVWWVRRLSVRWQMVLGTGLYLFGAAVMLLIMGVMIWTHHEGKHDIFATIGDELNAYRGGFVPAMVARFWMLLMMHVIMLPFTFFWMASGMFIWGMALTRTGVLTGERSSAFYAKLGVGSLLLGLLLTVGTILLLELPEVELIELLFQATAQLLGAPISIGYACLLIWIYKKGLLRPVTTALGAIGRMAMSNYLLQTLLCTTFFYGYGLGYYGEIQYPQLWLVVVSVWAINIVFSLLWLRRFRFGPAEWAWRSLTYFRLQPLLKARPTESVAASPADPPA